MGIVTKGENRFYINSPATTPLLFTKWNAAGTLNQDSNATLADTMQIQGIAARVRVAGLTNTLRCSRARAATKKKLTIDATNTGQIDLVAAPTVGAVIRFVVYTSLIHGQSVAYHNQRAGLGDQYSKRHFFTVKIRPGDTELTILQRFVQQVNGNVQFEYGVLDYTASISGNVVSIEAKFPDLDIVLGAFDKVDVYSTQLAVFSPVTAVESYEGLNTFKNLFVDRLETEARNEEYSLQQYDSPIKGQSYTCVEFFTRVERPDLTMNELADGGPVGNMNCFTLFIADGNEAYLNDLITFLSRSGAAVLKYYAVRTNADATTSGDLQNATKAEFLADAA